MDYELLSLSKLPNLLHEYCSCDYVVSGAGSTRSITPEGPIQEEPSDGEYFAMNPHFIASGTVHYYKYCYISGRGFSNKCGMMLWQLVFTKISFDLPVLIIRYNV